MNTKEEKSMEKEFLEKNVEVLVAFGGSVNDSGVAPIVYRGKLVEVDKSYVKLNAFYSEIAYTSVMGTRFSKPENTTILINREYVIYMKTI